MTELASRAPAAKRSTIRDLLTLVSGTAGAQLAGLLVLPILARSFAPEAFGVFQLYLSMLIVCTVGVALRIELTLLSRPDGEVSDAVRSLLALVVVTSVLVTVALSAYDSIWTPLGFAAPLLGVGLIGNGFAQVASFRLIREQRFSRLAVIKVSQVLVYAGVALVIALARPTLTGLIAADVAGRLASGALGYRFAFPGGGPLSLVRAIGGIGRFVRRNWELAVFSLPGALANSAGAMLTPFMIFHVYGASAAGQYGLVDRAIGVPVAMAVNVGSQVFVGRINERLRGGERRSVLRLLLRIVLGGGLVCLAGAALAYPLLPFAFRLVFGEGWGTAADLARIMIFAYAAVMVGGVVNQTLVALSAYRLQSAWDLGWPVLIGSGWVLVTTMELDLGTAVTLHAAAIASLSVIFVVLCVIRLRADLRPGKGV